MINASNFLSVGIYQISNEDNDTIIAYSLEIRLPESTETEQIGVYESSAEAIEVENRLAKWLTNKYPEPIFDVPANGFLSKNNPK